jgi:hypothetical protein
VIDVREKPPLGVCPLEIFEHMRIKDLARAIMERGAVDELMFKWATELLSRIGASIDRKSE